jgi:hypothetical protein
MDPKEPPSARLADTALTMVNKAIVDHKDVHKPPFIRARFNLGGNLILTTGYSTCGLDYEAYLRIITDSLSSLGSCTGRINERWSKFVLHGIPTVATMDEVRDEIETNYPALRLAQTPRWLTTEAQREEKPISSVVIAILGSITLDQIGTETLELRNRSCRLDNYVQFDSTTQCRYCQCYGHHTQKCTKLTPTCAVCAESHLTKDHPCTIPTCKKGPACTHPPIKCINCNAPHKASDRHCPMRIKLREARHQRIQRREPLIPPPDQPMEEQL